MNNKFFDMYAAVQLFFMHRRNRSPVSKYLFLLPSYLYNAVFCIFFRHNCQKCMVIHEKHPNVLQYKESKNNIFLY